LLTISLIIGPNPQSLSLYLGITALRGVWIWARATLPRYRYDILINLAWKTFLPVSLNYALAITGILLWLA
jgi:NADH:ubiquinone oxidoreductase subunit H